MTAPMVPTACVTAYGCIVGTTQPYMSSPASVPLLRVRRRAGPCGAGHQGQTWGDMGRYAGQAIKGLLVGGWRRDAAYSAQFTKKQMVIVPMSVVMSASRYLVVERRKS